MYTVTDGYLVNDNGRHVVYDAKAWKKYVTKWREEEIAKTNAFLQLIMEYESRVYDYVNSNLRYSYIKGFGYRHNISLEKDTPVYEILDRLGFAIMYFEPEVPTLVLPMINYRSDDLVSLATTDKHAIECIEKNIETLKLNLKDVLEYRIATLEPNCTPVEIRLSPNTYYTPIVGAMGGSGGNGGVGHVSRLGAGGSGGISESVI